MYIYRKKFNKNSNFTFATHSKDNKLVCPNCGNEGTSNEFFEGCPYCDTSFNMDYQLKRYDINLIKDKFSMKKFKIINSLIALIIPFTFTFIAYQDLRLSLLTILFFPFSFMITYLIMSFLYSPFIIINLIINTFKESYNIKSGKINRNKIINSLIYELKHYYFNDEKYKDLVDFDILVYYSMLEKKFNDGLCIDIKYKIRKYHFKNKKIKKKINKEKVRLKYNYLYRDKDTNIINCDNCGASIDITKKHCEYCKTKINSISE